MWKLDHKESWAPKNWCLRTVVLGKILESPLNCKEIQSVHPKGDQSWVFIGGTDVEAETPILWPPDVKSWLIWKDPDAGKDWRQEKGMTEVETVGRHHRLNGHEFEQALVCGDGHESPECCSPWGHTESVMTLQLNWTWSNISWSIFIISKLYLSLYFNIESSFKKTQIITCDIFFSIIVKYLQIISRGPGSIIGAWNASMNKTKTLPLWSLYRGKSDGKRENKH